jgi:hypothetical protein
MAGRPRKPTELHALEGTRPGATTRDRGAEPACNPLGPPPASLKNKRGEACLNCWHEIVGALPPGVITESDRFTVEIAARLLARFRGPAGLKASELSSLQRALSSLGMTPVDRSRVGVGKGDDPEPDSPWDRLTALDGGAA